MRRRVFGHLDPDRLLAGDRRQDADVGRGQRVGEVVGELGHLLHLGAGRQAQLVAGDVRAADDADDLRLDPEVAERLDQLAADRFLVARVGALVGPCRAPALSPAAAGSRSPPTRDAALVAHRGQGDLLGAPASPRRRSVRVLLGVESPSVLGVESFVGASSARRRSPRRRSSSSSSTRATVGSNSSSSG